MATLTINDKAYDISKLSAEAKTQVTNLRFVEAEIAKLNATVAVMHVARKSFIQALMPHLEGAPEKKSALN
ncbi:MAG: DUF6447 family protein [Ramlibacter sp.]|nr:DUF6447 family protein [Ramlibacter sp.]